MARNNNMSAKDRRRRRVFLLSKSDRCWLCGGQVDAETATLDHVVPRSRGGTNAIKNLRLAHRACNMRRCAAPGRPLMFAEAS